MKKLIVIAFISALSIVNAQFKTDLDSKSSVSNGILNTNPITSIFSFINPDNFSMHHTIDFSFSSFGSLGNMSLGVYTNSMEYKFSDRLNIQTDISVVNSPFNSFGSDFSKQINGIYLSKAAVNFKISDNMKIFVEYRSVPGALYSPFGYSSFSPFNRDSFSSSWGF
jgi:hypothetical protein